MDLGVLHHRGPDGRHTKQLENSALGHTRLAIVDIETGDQPFSNAQGNIWMVCNGEIYNHRDIRAQFPDYPFKTLSDNEVILPLYERYGVDAIRHLDGMFAFALVDMERGLFYMGRDPIGIKPLYYGWRGDTFVFGSEIKMIQGQVASVQEMLPGHWYSNQHGMQQYFDLKTLGRESVERGKEDTPTLDDIRETFTRAVHKRLMSDVPLGVYLSGGLDSTIVASVVAQELPDVHSFAVGVEGSIDLENARAAAESLGTQHHETIYTLEDMLQALPEVIYHLESFDPSLVRSAIPNYFLARTTREHVTVVLTGEGADELYAGYHYLKEYDEDTLHDELIALTGTLYNCNLQRCDRMTMAHSIEGRVPFLDVDFLKTSFAVPNDQKIKNGGNQRIEKWALRKAFEDIVPDHVTWRVKEQFSKGAGSSHLLEQYAEQQYSDEVFVREQNRIRQQTGKLITSKEMLLYYNEYRKHFQENTLDVVEVWIGRDAIPA